MSTHTCTHTHTTNMSVTAYERGKKTITMGGLEDFCEILKAAENRVGFTIENNTLSDCEIVKVKKKLNDCMLPCSKHKL